MNGFLRAFGSYWFVRRLVVSCFIVASILAVDIAGGTKVHAEERATTPALPRTILFLDDEDVLYRPGTIKRVVEFQKQSADPVIAPDKPWEGMIGWTSVYRNPATGKYQLWYQAYQERRKEDKRLKCVVCYATSDDGIAWTKPNLGLIPFFETKETNIVLIGAGDDEQGGYGDRYCNSVLVDERETDPARRYKMAYYDWGVGKDAKLGSGTHVAFSPDGIHWTKHAGMVSKTPFGGKGMQPPFVDEGFYFEETLKTGVVRKSWRVPTAMSDALDVLYDPLLERYVGYGKMWTPGPDGGLSWKHGMGRIESTDFLHWTKPELVLTVNDRDPPHVEFHTSPVFFYNGMYCSLNQILDRGRGTMDAEFMTSRDGRRWDRTFANTWVIPRGKPERFDAGSIITNGTPVVLDDEVRFYYAGYRGTAIGGVGLNSQELGTSDYYSGVGLAKTPRDRFVAVGPNPHAPVKGQKKDKAQLTNTIGHVTLKALDLSGAKSITVNADAAGGAVRVELLNEDGYRLRGFTKDDAVPLTADDLAQPAAWKEKSLADLPAGRYLVRVHLEKADLYGVTLK
ncbi:MAG: hypothetical protein C0483_10785 [Pirellula sp.]|nr:hypothetical protein [Pirellula sp.]